MHPLFGEWYRKASIEPKGEDLTARWKAIENFIQLVDELNSLELVRCFLGLPVSTGFTEQFQKCLLDADPAFPIRHKVEMQVLAGASIIAVLDSQFPISDTLALVFDAAAAKRLRKPAIVPEIVEAVTAYLFQRSAAVRTPPARQQVVGADNEQLVQAAKAAFGTGQWPQIFPALENVLRALDASVKNLAKLTELSDTAIVQAGRAQMEESNIVWWIFGEHSRDVRERFSGLPSSFAAVLAGKELADLTCIVPGPRAAVAYLDRVLEGHNDKKKLSLSDIGTGLPKNWIENFPFGGKLVNLCPVIFVMQECARGRKPAEAETAAQKQFSLGNSSLAPLEVAVQVYRECLALKVVP